MCKLCYCYYCGMYVEVWVHTSWCTCEIRKQRLGVVSLLPCWDPGVELRLAGFRGNHSYTTDPSCQPVYYVL